MLNAELRKAVRRGGPDMPERTDRTPSGGAERRLAGFGGGQPQVQRQGAAPPFKHCGCGKAVVCRMRGGGRRRLAAASVHADGREGRLRVPSAGCGVKPHRRWFVGGQLKTDFLAFADTDFTQLNRGTPRDVRWGIGKDVRRGIGDAVFPGPVEVR